MIYIGLLHDQPKEIYIMQKGKRKELCFGPMDGMLRKSEQTEFFYKSVSLAFHILSSLLLFSYKPKQLCQLKKEKS